MDIYKLENMVRGWFVGDFKPAAYKTKDFEVGLLTHKKNEPWPAHYHEHITEINLLIKGKIKFDSTIIETGDIFVFNSFEVARPEFLEDCVLVCIKTPSMPWDKKIV